MSSELVLVSQSHIYSFLGGTRAEAFPSRANDLLKHEVILWGHRAGKQSFVLGGGYGGADGIFRYKLSFAPRGKSDFKVGKMVVDPNWYTELMSLRRAFEESAGNHWTPESGFFPWVSGVRRV